MFQTFDSPPVGADRAGRLSRLRQLMAKAGVDAFLVPRSDEHQGEYVPPCAERLAWLTGFTGSAGLAIITRKEAAAFVDGRYTVQARSQLDPRSFEILEIPGAKASEWLQRKLPSGAVIGFDPKLHSMAWIDDLAAAVKAKGLKLKALGANPVDRAWGKERPAQPMGSVIVHPLKYAGKPADQKIADLQATLRKDGHDAVVLTLPDSIAWLLNIRGSDVAHNPVALAFAIVPVTGKPELFIEPAKIDAEAKAHLSPLVKISSPKALEARLAALKAAGKKIRLDPGSASAWFFRKLKGGKGSIARAADPCQFPKAKKNSAEIKGARTAHKRDGAAVVRFLAWLDREAAKGGVDEIGAATQLEAMRAQTQALKEISFDTISGAGPNGAIVHYRVTDATNRKLKSGELFLVDSGAQYLDGTTDITRTVAVGEPMREMRERFTLVLKGHIGVACARFPKGTRGIDLDPLARRALWQAGLDFDHGTGHGVGSYLSVHEGPQSISKRGMVVLEPGMIISNEPGYYKEGAYGIRIENLVLVTEPAKVPGGDREVMGFETLTLAPIDRRLVVPEMLTTEELAWLDDYHVRVREMVAPELGQADRAWLEAATAPIG